MVTPAGPVARHERRIGLQLLGWAALSVTVGAVLLFGGAFWRGLGLQCLVWGLIDAAIAGVGLWRGTRRPVPGADPGGDPVRRAAFRLRRLLLVNTGLDVLYLGAGIAILLLLDGPFARGNGWGVILQGGFLLVFDGLHALALTVGLRS